MTKKKGNGLLMVWADVPAAREAEFNRWYNEEHLAERLSIPGFLSGARYEAVKGGPKHLACYELTSVAVLQGEAYTRVQKNPTEWTTRCSPEAIGTTYIRNVCIGNFTATPCPARQVAGRLGMPSVSPAERETPPVLPRLLR